MREDEEERTWESERDRKEWEKEIGVRDLERKRERGRDIMREWKREWDEGYRALET